MVEEEHAPPRSPSADDDRFDVAIVGLGPVGGVLATLLGQQGRRTLVVERHRAPYPMPRAVHFDHEVGRILQAIGLGPQLPAISEPGGAYEWRNARGDVLLRFGGREVGPSGWPDMNMFWQPALEALIEQAAAAQPTVEVRRGLRLVGLHDRGDHVALEVVPEGAPDAPAADTPAPDATSPHVVEARLVVGCDGARSTVRDLVGMPVTDLGFFYDWLIVDLDLHEPRAFDPVNQQVCDPVRPTTLVSGGPGRRRWEFMRLPHETVEELDDEARAWELLEPWDVTPANATLERRAVYRFQARWADRWRAGNVLLAGDAAHQMPPFAGQGMCSGLRDALNLAWKLDLVLDGRSPMDLLDHYSAERRENVRAVIDFSMALGQVICITDPEAAAARDEQMVGAVRPGEVTIPPPLPGITTGTIRAGDPTAGTLFVQGRVADGDLVRRLDDVVGIGWRLVTTDPAVTLPVDHELAAWFAARGGALVLIDAADDVDGTYGAWFREHGVVAALQRPDFHLYGSARTPADVDPLLADLRSALDRPSPPGDGPDPGAGDPAGSPDPLGGPS